MTRPLTPETSAAVEKPTLPLAVIMSLDIEGDPLLAWTGIGDLPFAGGQPRTNYIANNTGANPAANGVPATWQVGGSGTGLTRTVVGSGKIDNIEYVDIRVTGTPTNNGLVDIYFHWGLENFIPVELGQDWVFSSYLAVVGENQIGVDRFLLHLAQYTAAGAIITDGNLDIIVDGQFTRKYVTRKVTNATAGLARPWVRIDTTQGVAVDVTLRIGLPQFEKGTVPKSEIRTAGAFITVTDPGETGDPSLDGKTFKGLGTIVELSTVSDGVGGSDALEVTLPGVDPYEPMLRQLITNRNRWQFRRAVVWLMALDPDTDEIAGKPFRIKTGRIDKMPFTENEAGIVKCVIEGQQAYSNNALGTRYSEQRDINPKDNSQAYVHYLANVTAELGKPSASASPSLQQALNNAAGGGGFVSSVARLMQ